MIIITRISISINIKIFCFNRKIKTNKEAALFVKLIWLVDHLGKKKKKILTTLKKNLEHPK